MAAPHVGCSNNSPLRVIPDVGKVTEDPAEPEREMAPDVLQHNDWRECRPDRVHGTEEDLRLFLFEHSAPVV